MKILIIDNYDSFTYNLVHYFEIYTDEITVIKNDEIQENTIYPHDLIILSPGPGLPKDSAKLMHFIHIHFKIKKIFGVCLGMQALAFYTHPQSLYNLKKVKHGKMEEIIVLEQENLFNFLKIPIYIGLYHSWAVNDTISDQWKITAKSKENVIMSIKHKKYPIWGVQFHPESIMTEQGKKMIENLIIA